MKKIIGAVGVALLMVLCYLAGRQHSMRHSTVSLSGPKVLYWVDPMHPDYRSDHPGTAPDCGMQLEPVYAEPVASSTMPASPLVPGTVGIDLAKQQLYGIQVATVQKTSNAESLRVLGRVVPEDTRLYRVTSGSDGFVRETYNDSVGEFVQKNQKLASSYAGETLAVASGYLAAIAGVPGANGKDGNRAIPHPGVISKQGVSSLQGYSDRLRNLGVSEAQLDEMSSNRLLPETVEIVSPTDGFILFRNISAGQHFDRSMEFYRIADLTKVWILVDVFGSEAPNFRPGTIAHATLSDGGRAFTARVTNILPQVDPTTRTLKLRLEADNPGFALRPDMFVDVLLPVAARSGLTVPLDAVIDSGREQRVFVERSQGVFEPRQVTVGWRSPDRVEIVRGLTEGERVISAGTFLVDSESRLRSAQTPPPSTPHETVPPKSRTEPGVAANTGKVKDAACGMLIDSAKAVADGNTISRDGVTYYFCSDRCKRKFSAQPEHYLASNPSGHHS
jgi:membrane fusion protein, copper/silver efflux system